VIPDETGSDMGLAVFSVLRSELVEVPVLPPLVQVVADAVELVLGPDLDDAPARLPHAGKVFATDGPGARGLPCLPYRGSG
jgi:hypothetical protein